MNAPSTPCNDMASEATPSSYRAQSSAAVKTPWVDAKHPIPFVVGAFVEV